MPESRWGLLLIKLVALGAASYFFGIFILITAGAILAFMWLVSKLLPRGFLSSVAVQVVSFMLTRRLVGPIPSVPVRDFRIRDSVGQETLVRMKGQLISGSVTIGDDVLVEGWERHGMLLFRKGYNNRIQAAIQVKSQ
jgi:membrane protein implicated in regulation of membrane protease activity